MGSVGAVVKVAKVTYQAEMVEAQEEVELLVVLEAVPAADTEAEAGEVPVVIITVQVVVIPAEEVMVEVDHLIQDLTRITVLE
jgi:hypothetical protein